MIKNNQAIYKKSPRYAKFRISKCIVKAIQDTGGRFLKQNKRDRLWYEISQQMAIRKVSQGLREKYVDKHSTSKATNYNTVDLMPLPPEMDARESTLYRMLQESGLLPQTSGNFTLNQDGDVEITNEQNEPPPSTGMTTQVSDWRTSFGRIGSWATLSKPPYQNTSPLGMLQPFAQAPFLPVPFAFQPSNSAGDMQAPTTKPSPIRKVPPTEATNPDDSTRLIDTNGEVREVNLKKRKKESPYVLLPYPRARFEDRGASVAESPTDLEQGVSAALLELSNTGLHFSAGPSATVASEEDRSSVSMVVPGRRSYGDLLDDYEESELEQRLRKV